MMTGVVSKIVLTIAVGCVAAFSFLYFNQEKFIFHPEVLTKDHVFPFSVPFEEIWIESDGVKVHTVLFPKEDPDGVVLYFHGNAGSLREWGTLHTDFDAHPYDLWIMDYRGFGKSEGKLTSEAVLHADALKMWEAAKQRYPDKEVIIYGRSIGTGVASALAAKHPPKLLILETPYYNLPDLVKQIAPWAPPFLLRYRLMNDQYITNQPFPIHLIHGDRDALIPVSSSERLSTLGDHIEFHLIKGAEHNNVPSFRRYHEVLGSLLAQP